MTANDQETGIPAAPSGTCVNQVQQQLKYKEMTLAESIASPDSYLRNAGLGQSAANQSVDWNK